MRDLKVEVCSTQRVLMNISTANSPPYQSLFKYYATADARRPLRLTRMGAITNTISDNNR